MNLTGRSFAPAWWATLATLCGVTLTLVLGFWQLGRADTKQVLQSRIDEFSRQPPTVIGKTEVRAEDLILRRVEARGRFDPSHVVFIDNRLYKHVPGYYVMMPLRLDGNAGSGKYVLVNRGWVAAGSERNRVPLVNTPDAEVTVIGTAMPASERFLELSSKVAQGNIWQNMVLERYRQATKLDVQPIIIQQSSVLDDGLIRDWPAADLKRNTHLAYAVQWFALAAAILIYYVVTNVRKRPDSGANGTR